MEEGGQKVQTLSYKISQSQGCNAHHGDYSYNIVIAYLKVAQRVHLKSSHGNNKIL